MGDELAHITQSLHQKQTRTTVHDHDGNIPYKLDSFSETPTPTIKTMAFRFRMTLQPSKCEFSFRRSRSIILHLILHLLLLQQLSNPILYYFDFATPPPPNCSWEILSFILFVLRVRDVGILIVFLNNTRLWDWHTPVMARAWVRVDATLVLGFVILTIIIIVTSDRESFNLGGLLWFVLWLATATASVVSIVAGCHDGIIRSSSFVTNMNYLPLILWVYLKGLGVAGWVHPVVSSVPKYILLRKQVVRPMGSHN